MEIEKLAPLVEEIYQANGNEPFYLSTFGMKLRAYWRDKYGEELPNEPPMADLVNSTPGFKAAYPAGSSAMHIARIDQTPVLKSAYRPFSEIRRSLLGAFVCPSRHGETVYYQKEPPYKFDYYSSPPADQQFVEIRDEDRLPDIGYRLAELPDAPKNNLFDKIKAWAAAKGVPEKAVYFTPVRIEEHDSALGRFISAQDPEILPRILMPADIVELLRRSK